MATGPYNGPSTWAKGVGLHTRKELHWESPQCSNCEQFKWAKHNANSERPIRTLHTILNSAQTTLVASIMQKLHHSMPSPLPLQHTGP